MLKRDELADPNSCLNKAKDDEPIFVLLGRDASAAPAIIEWTASRIELGLNLKGDAQIRDAYKIAEQMLMYERNQPE